MQDTDMNDQNEDATPSQPVQLTSIELRVLGALMEKQLTTPDQYPLTTNSILTACNQKSSRDPVSNYHQGELVRALQGLEERQFVRREFGSRADKYSQHFMSHLELGKKQQALLCVMMLRGPQTLSELSTRTQRMEQFNDKDELVHCLERLCERQLPYVMRLGHQPGQRGERFGHLFSGIPESSNRQSESTSTHESVPDKALDHDAMELLELKVAELSEQVQALEHQNSVFTQQLNKLYELTGHPLSVEQQSPQDE